MTLDETEALVIVTKALTAYVKRGPYYLNPDEVVVKNILLGLTKNLLEHGQAYCPCRQVQGIPEQDSNNICPCSTHRKDITQTGSCDCGLFVNNNYLIRVRKKPRDA